MKETIHVLIGFEVVKGQLPGGMLLGSWAMQLIVTSTHSHRAPRSPPEDNCAAGHARIPLRPRPFHSAGRRAWGNGTGQEAERTGSSNGKPTEEANSRMPM